MLAAYAKGLGVPAERIAVTGVVRNTADESREVAGLLRARQVQAPGMVLVTAAFHMRRARQVFEQQGLMVERSLSTSGPRRAR